MQIAPMGAGAAGADPAGAKLTAAAGGLGPVGKPGGVSGATQMTAESMSDAAAIRELAASDLLKLSQILTPAHEPGKGALIDNLLREAVRAVDEGRVEWAVGRLVEVVTLNPQRAEELKAAPEFAIIRENVEHLLGRLTNVARMDAEGRLSQAEQVLGDAGWQKLPDWETRPETLLQIARNLFEAGGYANYVRSGQLAQATVHSAIWEASLIQAQMAAAETGNTRHFGQFIFKDEVEPPPRKKWMEGLWKRAPALILLLAWLALGVTGSIVALIARRLSTGGWLVSAADMGSVWGLGLVALVGFGLYARLCRMR